MGKMSQPEISSILLYLSKMSFRYLVLQWKRTSVVHSTHNTKTIIKQVNIECELDVDFCITEY